MPSTHILALYAAALGAQKSGNAHLDNITFAELAELAASLAAQFNESAIPPHTCTDDFILNAVQRQWPQNL